MKIDIMQDIYIVIERDNLNVQELEAITAIVKSGSKFFNHEPTQKRTYLSKVDKLKIISDNNEDWIVIQEKYNIDPKHMWQWKKLVE